MSFQEKSEEVLQNTSSSFSFNNSNTPFHKESTCTTNEQLSIAKQQRIRLTSSRDSRYSETINFSLRNNFSSIGDTFSNGSRSVQDDREQGESERMDSGYNKGLWSSVISTSNHSNTSNSNSFNIQKRSWLRGILLMFSVPFATLSINQMKASAAWYDRFNPISPESQEKISSIIDTITKVIMWFKNIKDNMVEISTDLMIWTYETLTKVVLHTPSFLFDSDWFRNNIVTFSGLSIAMSIVLAMFEGFQRMSGGLIKNKQVTDLRRIIKRFPLVVIGSAIAPSLFYYTFKGLNGLTNIIIDFGKHQMDKGIQNINMDDITLLQIVGLIGFDVALISILIPILLQNFRRWFDLLTLGAMTPLALSCWVFNAYEHLFTMWWEHIKKCASVQIVYAVFLLIIGTLLFGTKLPNSGWDILIQLGIVIGGLWRLNSPPMIISRNIDRGGDIKTMWDGASKVIRPLSAFRKKKLKVAKK